MTELWVKKAANRRASVDRQQTAGRQRMHRLDDAAVGRGHHRGIRGNHQRRGSHRAGSSRRIRLRRRRCDRRAGAATAATAGTGGGKRAQLEGEESPFEPAGKRADVWDQAPAEEEYEYDDSEDDDEEEYEADEDVNAPPKPKKPKSKTKKKK